jgi:hypothetical protein
MASANNTLIGALRAEATLESGKFVDGAKKIKLAAKDTEASVKSSFSSMGAAVKGFGGALTAGLSIGLLGGLAKKALDFAAAIGTTAKQLGVTTKELQLFRYAAEQVGVKNAEADKGLERLGVTLGKAAAGSTTAQKALGAVGVTLQDISTKTRSQIFGQIADQMNRQGGAAKNAAAANAIFGESASKLTPLLDKGSQGINELSAAAERLGVVLSDRQIQQADETARKLDDVRSVLSAQIAGVVADNAASIVTLANALASLTSSIVNFLGSNPQAALGILGALAGGRVGGLPGAAAGGLAGMFAGAQVAAGARDSNGDLRFRAQQIRKAQAEYARAKSLYGGGPAGATDRARAAKELARQNALGQQALARANARTAAPGGAAIPQFLAPPAKSGGGRKGRTPRAPKDTSLRDAYQFDTELRRAQMDVLRATQSLSNDYVERASIAIELLNLEKEQHEAELKYRVASGEITEAQAQQLRLEYDKTDALERQAVIADEQAQRAEDVARLQAVDFDLEREKLESEAALAETASEQRDIALRLLDLSYRQERARLQGIIAEEEAKDIAQQNVVLMEEARRRLAGMAQTYGNAKQAVMQGTRGPLEGYMASLPLTAAKWEEALQSVAVNGFQALEDSIISVIDGTKSLGEAFRDMASQIISDLLRISIQKAIIAPLVGALFPSAAGAAVPGFASGGSMMIGGMGGIDRNVLALNGLPIARVSRGESLNISPQGGGAMMGGAPVHIHMSGPMSDAQARRTGMQAAAGFRAEQARSVQKGIS